MNRNAGLLALLVLVVAIAATSSAAWAAPYTITSCGTTGGAVGWTVQNGSPGGLVAGIECPPVADHQAAGYFAQTGIFVGDRLVDDGGNSYTPQNASASVTFTPAVGTTITRFQYQ